MNYDGIKICGVPDELGQTGTCQWPFKDVLVHGSGMLGEVDLGEGIARAVKDPLGWNGVCGIRLQQTTNPNTAHIRVSTGGIDGPHGTLAWCQLPCGFTRLRWQACKMLFDTGDIYVFAENPPGGKIDWYRVWWHEGGHGIGIPHITEGNLMQPMYSNRIRFPQRGDILEARGRYGLPETQPPGTPGEPPTNPPTVPTDPAEPDLIGRLFPCFAELDSQERAVAIKIVLKGLAGLWQYLSPEEKRMVAELRKEAFRFEE